MIVVEAEEKAIVNVTSLFVIICFMLYIEF